MIIVVRSRETREDNPGVPFDQGLASACRKLSENFICFGENYPQGFSVQQHWRERVPRASATIERCKGARPRRDHARCGACVNCLRRSRDRDRRVGVVVDAAAAAVARPHDVTPQCLNFGILVMLAAVPRASSRVSRLCCGASARLILGINVGVFRWPNCSPASRRAPSVDRLEPGDETAQTKAR